MDGYAAEPPDLGHPENEGPITWFGSASGIADQVATIIAITQVVSLAITAGILLTYAAARQRRMGDPASLLRTVLLPWTSQPGSTLRGEPPGIWRRRR